MKAPVAGAAAPGWRVPTPQGWLRRRVGPSREAGPAVSPSSVCPAPRPATLCIARSWTPQTSGKGRPSWGHSYPPSPCPLSWPVAWQPSLCRRRPLASPAPFPALPTLPATGQQPFPSVPAAPAPEHRVTRPGPGPKANGSGSPAPSEAEARLTARILMGPSNPGPGVTPRKGGHPTWTLEHFPEEVTPGPWECSRKWGWGTSARRIQ